MRCAARSFSAELDWSGISRKHTWCVCVCVYIYSIYVGKVQLEGAEDCDCRKGVGVSLGGNLDGCASQIPSPFFFYNL